MRMEVPNEARKWDKPLFTVKPTDATPCQAIFDALLSDKAHKPSVNQATLPVCNVGYCIFQHRRSKNLQIPHCSTNWTRLPMKLSSTHWTIRAHLCLVIKRRCPRQQKSLSFHN